MLTRAEAAEMAFAEAGYPGVLRPDPDGLDWSVPLTGGDAVPEEVWWRVTQLVVRQFDDLELSWCWACCRSGYDAEECESVLPGEQDCGRSRG